MQKIDSSTGKGRFRVVRFERKAVQLRSRRQQVEERVLAQELSLLRQHEQCVVVEPDIIDLTQVGAQGQDLSRGRHIEIVMSGGQFSPKEIPVPIVAGDIVPPPS